MGTGGVENLCAGEKWGGGLERVLCKGGVVALSTHSTGHSSTTATEDMTRHSRDA